MPLSLSPSPPLSPPLSLSQARGSSATTDALPSQRTDESTQLRSRAKTFGSARQSPGMSSSASGPRTLRDYQQLSARSQGSKVKSRDADDDEKGMCGMLLCCDGVLVVFM